MKKLEPQYKIFYSWQSDNQPARDMIDKALKDIVKDFGKQGVSIERIEGGGGMGFIGIKEAVRMKIQSCDIFIGDITPVGNVALKEKSLLNANVMFEMGIATECLSAEQIIAVAAKGEWKFENLPFDINHNSYYQLDPDKIESVNYLFHLIKSRLISAKARSEHINRLYFADWLVQKNIATGKYLPDTFLEDRELKDKVKCFVHPSKMYQIVFDRLSSMSFAMYDKRNARRGKNKPFTLRLNDYDLSIKAFDLNSLHRKVEGLYNNLSERINFLDKDGNNGWRTAQKVRHQADRVILMNRKFLVIKSDAGQGKTNFLCDIIRNFMKPEHVPYGIISLLIGIYFGRKRRRWGWRSLSYASMPLRLNSWALTLRFSTCQCGVMTLLPEIRLWSPAFWKTSFLLPTLPPRGSLPSAIYGPAFAAGGTTAGSTGLCIVTACSPPSLSSFGVTF